MIYIFDNVLDEKEMNYILTRKMFHSWFDETHPIDSTLSNILKKLWSKSPIKFKQNAGVEIWYNKGFTPKIHIDKDEVMLKEKGIKQVPLYGMCYYPHKIKPEGGELIIHYPNEIAVKMGVKATSIEPLPNRLVFFPSGKFVHEIKPFKGERYCFASNMWGNKIRGYTKPDGEIVYIDKKD